MGSGLIANFSIQATKEDVQQESKRLEEVCAKKMAEQLNHRRMSPPVTVGSKRPRSSLRPPTHGRFERNWAAAGNNDEWEEDGGEDQEDLNAFAKHLVETFAMRRKKRRLV